MLRVRARVLAVERRTRCTAAPDVGHIFRCVCHLPVLRLMWLTLRSLIPTFLGQSLERTLSMRIGWIKPPIPSFAKRRCTVGSEFASRMSLITTVAQASLRNSSLPPVPGSPRMLVTISHRGAALSAVSSRSTSLFPALRVDRSGLRAIVSALPLDSVKYFPYWRVTSRLESAAHEMGR